MSPSAEVSTRAEEIGSDGAGELGDEGVVGEWPWRFEVWAMCDAPTRHRVQHAESEVSRSVGVRVTEFVSAHQQRGFELFGDALRADAPALIDFRILWAQSYEGTQDAGIVKHLRRGLGDDLFDVSAGATGRYGGRHEPHLLPVHALHLLRVDGGQERFATGS